MNDHYTPPHYILFIAHWNPSAAVKKKIRGTHRTFSEMLVDAPLIQYKTAPLVRKYTSSGHLPRARLDKPRRIHQRVKSSSCRKCQFRHFRIDMLYTRHGHIGGVGRAKSVRQSRLIWGHCGVYLCSNCFDLFHNFKSILWFLAFFIWPIVEIRRISSLLHDLYATCMV